MNPATDSTVSSASVVLQADVEQRVQLAAQQRRRPLVHWVSVHNPGSTDALNITVCISVDPEVAAPVRLPLARVPAGITVRLEAAAIPMPLLVDRLVDQTERVDGNVRIHVEGASAAPVICPVQVLAFDEWAGAAAPPDLLASFVTPNHPATADVLGHTRQVLTSRGLDPSLEGYQRQDPRRVQELAAAVYASVGHARISYAGSPASFEQTGQRVRTIDRILQEGAGNCLDLSLAMCSAMEQIGLNTMIVVIRGHAFPAVWLRSTMLPTTWTDEPSLLRNRLELGELLPFDSSAAASGVDFVRACDIAKAALQGDTFLFAVDIAASRQAMIRPLPLKKGEVPAPVSVGRVKATATMPDELPALPVGPSLQADAFANESSSDRMRRWKERLLDMSLNNRLLHQKPRKTMVTLLTDLPAELEDQLNSRASLMLSPRAHATVGDDPVPAANQSLEQGVLIADATEGDLFARATELYRTSRTLEDDSGVSPLYLTIGALRWYESPSSSMERRAPVLMIPVKLARDSVRGPFRIKRSDEDALVNAAMLRKLESEFGVPTAGLEELPEDENGIDVARVLANVRYAIRDIPRFEVLNTCSLDLLSFAKYLMWSDLELNADALASNSIVQRLLKPDSPAIRQPAAFARAETLDEQRPAASDLSVLDADSTQMAATFSALDGNTFIIQGPPGTGKSQTITNLIAQAVAVGKTVLFVAEKRAALEVVETRLKGIGLGAFTLEAHSDKATRAEIVRQLGEPLTIAREQTSDQWQQMAAELQRVRTELNAHCRRINRRGPWGETLQQAMGRLLELSDAPQIPLELPIEPARELVDRWRHHLVELRTEAQTVGDVSTNPWRIMDVPPWTPDGQSRTGAVLGQLRERLVELQTAWTGFATWSGASAHDLRVEAWAALAATVLEAPARIPVSLLHARPTDVTDLLQAADQTLTNQALHRSRVEDALLPTVYEAAEFEDWRQKLVRWAGAFFVIRFFMLWGVRGALKSYARQALPAAPDLLTRMNEAARVRELNAEWTARCEQLRAVFGPLQPDATPRMAALQQAAAWTARFRQQLAQLDVDPARRSTLEQLVVDADERLAAGTTARQSLETLNAAVLALTPALHAAGALLRPQRPWLEGPLTARLATVDALTGTLPTLRNWSLFREVARLCEADGLGPLVVALSGGQLKPDELVPALERSIRERWLNHQFETDAALRSFRGARHQLLVDHFRQLDQQAQQLARREIRARLASRLPDPTAPGQMDVVRRELKKKRGHLPVRRLFAEVRDVLSRLKPVVLMSPQSVARNLDPSLPPFDLVIFDEASQIPPWDAIGALARGRQAIVVGDSRQLPPTSFFNKEVSEDTDDDERIDLESILDHCSASGMPEILLGWHYRSRHESLIAFSNHKYYDNRLHIFPSPSRDSPRLGVKLHPVPTGFYDRGGSRQNKAEAQAVVDAIAARVLDPATSHQSVGVVTFSQTQQRCVEDLLDQRRRDSRELENALQNLTEPLFIKNLENVQGDERDVMLFSIGYAPDQTGKLAMAFGPLNREGGERRLNVAVTRARELLEVYSTLRADQIDLSRTGATGVQHLKAFLEYAARGPSSLHTSAQTSPDAEFGSPFEEQVCRRLEALGWTVHRQVGVAGYRIDLAIVHPDAPGAYMVGVECDGAAYHSAATARDRDRLRQSVLERLGWRIYRIWSTDWWHEPDRIVSDLHQQLQTWSRLAPVGVATPPRAVPPPIVTSAEPPADTPTLEQVFAAATPTWPAEARPYAGLRAVQGGRQDDFYSPASRRPQIQQLQGAIAGAGPIAVAHLARHLSRAWGFAATSPNVVTHVTSLVRECPGLTLEHDAVWIAGDVQPRRFQYGGDADPGDRKFEELPVVEVAAALLWVVERSIGVSQDDAWREVARVFGAAKVGKTMRARCEQAMSWLVERGQLSVTDSGLTARTLSA